MAYVLIYYVCVYVCVHCISSRYGRTEHDIKFVEKEFRCSVLLDFVSSQPFHYKPKVEACFPNDCSGTDSNCS